MKPKNNKMTLVMAIILTIIALPLAVISTYGRILYPPNAPLACDIKLTGGACYTCTNKDGYCNYAYNYINDSKYALNYYKGTNNFITFSEGYVFLMDTPLTFNVNNNTEYPKTIMYGITNNNKLEVTGLNNYGIGFNGDYYIGIMDNGKYTLFRVNQLAQKAIEDEYDFIGAAGHLIDGKLDSSKFAVLKNNKWQLINTENTALTSEFENPIYDYSDYAVALYNETSNKYYLVDFQNESLMNRNFDKVFFYKDIVLGVSDNTLYIYDSASNRILSSTITISSPDDISVLEETDYIDISINDFKNTRVYYSGTIEDITNMQDDSTSDTNTNTNQDDSENIDNNSNNADGSTENNGSTASSDYSNVNSSSNLENNNTNTNNNANSNDITLNANDNSSINNAG